MHFQHYTHNQPSQSVTHNNFSHIQVQTQQLNLYNTANTTLLILHYLRNLTFFNMINITAQ